MQQLTVTRPDHLEWLDVPPPVLTSPQSALLRPVAVATCDFDHLIVPGRTALEMPMAIGHECVAEVVEAGAEVVAFRPGDLVIVPYQISCGTCAPCRKGNTSSCRTVPWLSCYGLGASAGGFGGAMSDLINVPFADAMLVGLPDGVSPADAAALSCNLPDAYRCVDAVAQQPGTDVLVVGGAFNNIALYAIQIALALGAGSVDYIDRDARRLDIAARLGANVIESTTDVAMARYPITVDASMDVDLLRLAIRATAPSGTCTVSTMYATDAVPLPMFTMFQNCITLRTGQPHVRALMEPVMELVANGLLRPELVTTNVVDWQSAAHAFGAHSGKSVCVR